MTTLKDRIGQAIYVLGCLAALFLLGWSVLVLILFITDSDGPLAFAMLVVFGLGSYGAGWGLRWIITGNSSSVLDRFK